MRKTKRGFAGVLAIVLIGLVGAALAALAAGFSMEAKRTREVNRDAQLRQMLIAAEIGARTGGEVKLPAAISDDGKIELKNAADSKSVRINARLGPRSMEQEIEYRGDSPREIVTAKLNGGD
jgi:type II secretory pathway component PulK